MQKPQLTSDIEVEELVSAYPELIPALTSRGVICIQCGAPIWGTLAEAVERKGLDPALIVEELRQILSGVIPPNSTAS